MTGDTIDVIDILTPRKNITHKNPNENSYRVRFEGVQSGELNKLDVMPGEVAITNPNSEGAKSLKYVSDALEGKLIVLRINPKNSSIILTADDVEAGAIANTPANYAVAIKGKNNISKDERYMASIFYRTDENKQNALTNKVRGIFLNMPTLDSMRRIEYLKNKTKELLSLNSVIESKFDEILAAIQDLPKSNSAIYFDKDDSNDPINAFSNPEKELFDSLVSILILQEVYSTASEWPYIGWDEYYSDGSPVTLNWELIIAGLGRVYTETLNFIKGPALIDPSRSVGIGKEVSTELGQGVRG